MPGGEEATTAAVTTAVGLHGMVPSFDSTQEEWSEYAERLVANDITDGGKKRAILLNGVGPAVYLSSH